MLSEGSLTMISVGGRTAMAACAALTFVLAAQTAVAAVSPPYSVSELTLQAGAGRIWEPNYGAKLLLGHAGADGADSLPMSLPTFQVSDGVGNGWVLGGDATLAAPAAGRTLSGDMSIPGFEVPAGQTWRFDPNKSTTVTVDANVVVRGRLEMRPASGDVVHTLRFVGIDETQIVGGHTEEPLASDVGLWVVGDGQVDFQGSETAGWNRTGTDPSWRPGDDIRVAPTAMGDYETFAAFSPGDQVPTVTGPDGTVYRSEVFNLTRNVRIEGGGVNTPEILSDNGRAHMMFLHTTRPQTIRNVELRWMGPRGPHDRDGTDGVMSRYPVHFHRNGDGSRGSVVERVVVRDSGNRAFVPHGSNGITFTDTVAFDVYESAYWWDPGAENASHDVTYDHAAAALIRDWPISRGYALKGFQLGEGTGNALRGSVAVGVLGRTANAGGFHWPSSANKSVVGNMWTFTDNVAHNNKSAGISVWENDPNPHVIQQFLSYRNREGISHGAYRNLYTYRDGVSFDERLTVHAVGGTTYDRLRVGGDIRLVKHTLPSTAITRFIDLELFGQVIVDERGSAGVFRFESSTPYTDLRPDDFRVIRRLSDITVVNADGSTFQVQ